MDSQKTIVVLCGPTGSGKTELAMAIAKRIPLEVISADSVQVYREFDIGSAKASKRELQEIPHHLVSTLDPRETFDAGRFCSLADSAIEQILAKQKLPLVVGGTGLYISALLGGLVEVEISQSAIDSLEELQNELFNSGKTRREVAMAFHQKLMKIDPKTAAALQPGDFSRLKRALVVAQSKGSSLKKLQDEHRHQTNKYRALVICLLPDRRELYSRINARVDKMMQNGLVEEVEALRAKFPASIQGFRAIGYRHVLSYLAGDIDKTAMVELLKRDTRRFAKRQYTWWNQQPAKLGWIELDANAELDYHGAGLQHPNAFSAARICDCVCNYVAAFLQQGLLKDEALQNGEKFESLQSQRNQIRLLRIMAV